MKFLNINTYPKTNIPCLLQGMFAIKIIDFLNSVWYNNLRYYAAFDIKRDVQFEIDKV